MDILESLFYVHAKYRVGARSHIVLFGQLVDVQILGTLGAKLLLVGQNLTYLGVPKLTDEHQAGLEVTKRCQFVLQICIFALRVETKAILNGYTAIQEDN